MVRLTCTVVFPGGKPSAKQRSETVGSYVNRPFLFNPLKKNQLTKSLLLLSLLLHFPFSALIFGVSAYIVLIVITGGFFCLFLCSAVDSLFLLFRVLYCSSPLWYLEVFQH